MPQLVADKPDMGSLSNLSTRAEGAPTMLAPISGEDRCDPQSPDHRETRACEKVIERRAADFAKPQPEQSPEQRLLTVDLGGSGGTASIADRVIGQIRSAADTPDARSSQELASIVLSPPPPPAPPQAPQGPKLDTMIADILKSGSPIPDGAPPN